MNASTEASEFELALSSYQNGAPLPQVIASFKEITQQAPRQSAGWTCLAWLQLLNGEPQDALH